MSGLLARVLGARASRTAGVAAAVGIVLAACSGAATPQATPSAAPQYQPQARTFTVTVVPLAVHEQADMLDYLKADFAKGGLLDGKEVYGMSPSSLTVYQGDTVTIHLVNPADDDHQIALAGGLSASVHVDGKSAADLKFVASKAGLFTIECVTPEHFPFMNGELVVLPAALGPQP